MHRFILRADIPLPVDHIDGDRLNNRRSNLRFVTQSQNCANAPARRRRAVIASQYKGVSWNVSSKRWYAGLTHQGEKIRLGLFEDEFDAAFAYDREARRRFGLYARLNFPEFWRDIDRPAG
jgi:hypothetical protein